ncbi:hypothetical protein Q9K02_11050 [Qipengyuania sp. G39]|uniref:Lipoprotein n=1 Tax=Qipengyuania profundimaris TaxID=3067652 RepID=A0ABT9HRA1_9SPHN|nr:hypothetical protein [Qipengyuania sp. G39]MDP4575676.1 hypothetical protein [Qipengyuania sp. G39]
MTWVRLGLGVACATMIAGCAPTETPPVEMPKQSAMASAPKVSATTETPDYPPDLQRMLEKSAFAGMPGEPCLAREIERPAWTEQPEVRSRLREVRSDSLWLGRWARENLSGRLAYAGVGYDFAPRPEETLPDAPPPLIYEIVVTGSDPIRPPPLGDRAKDVPVVVRYDAPLSHDEFMARREQGGPTARQLLPTLQGEGGSPSRSWAVYLMIGDSKKEGVVDDALSQCDALRRAYRLPVLMEFFEGSMTTLDMMPAPPE